MTGSTRFLSYTDWRTQSADLTLPTFYSPSAIVPAVETAAAGQDASAAGDIVLANAQPLNGATTGGAAQNGVTIFGAAVVLSGQPNAGASTTSAIVGATSSVVAGSAAGQGSKAGVLLTGAASLLGGAAGVTAMVPGTTLTALTSVIDEGPESGAGLAGAQTVFASTNVNAGAISSTAAVLGDAVNAQASFISAQVRGDGESAVGLTVESSVAIVPGPSNGNAIAEGDTLTPPPAAFMTGGAFGSAATPTDMLTAPASLMEGEVSSTSTLDGDASGDTLQTTAALVTGQAASEQSQNRGGGIVQRQRPARRQNPDLSIPFFQDGSAGGSIVSARTSLIEGDAIGGSRAIGNEEKRAVARLIGGIATAAGRTSKTRLRTELKVIPGRAGMSAATTSRTIKTQVSIRSGRADGFDAIAYDNTLITLIAA